MLCSCSFCFGGAGKGKQPAQQPVWPGDVVSVGASETTLPIGDVQKFTKGSDTAPRMTSAVRGGHQRRTPLSPGCSGAGALPGGSGDAAVSCQDGERVAGQEVLPATASHVAQAKQVGTRASNIRNYCAGRGTVPHSPLKYTLEIKITLMKLYRFILTDQEGQAEAATICVLSVEDGQVMPALQTCLFCRLCLFPCKGYLLLRQELSACTQGSCFSILQSPGASI